MFCKLSPPSQVLQPDPKTNLKRTSSPPVWLQRGNHERNGNIAGNSNQRSAHRNGVESRANARAPASRGGREGASGSLPRRARGPFFGSHFREAFASHASLV